MADDKLIFPIGFDLEEGVKEASKEWKSTYQKQLQKAIDDKPLKVKIDFESKGIDTKEFKQWMALSREAEKVERERIKNAREWQKVADQAAMAETRRANATNESNARIERANNKAEASEKRKRDAVERTNEAYKRQGGYLKRLFQLMVAYASVTQVFSFIRNIREVTAQFELQRVALGSIIGDLNEANAMFEQIKAAAVKSPFQIKELVTYTKQLAAYKIETDELFETTQRLADISAGLGVGMERLVLAYGQIRAAGYLRASEVRQLTEAGIPIVEELAKKMSQLRGETVSAAEVMGLISERAISFGMVKEVFDDMTSAGGMFYKMQEKQAETLAGQWSNLQDAISIMYDEIGRTESVNNVMKDMIGLVKTLAENWRELSTVISSTLGIFMAMRLVNKFLPDISNYAIRSATATRNYNRAIIEMRTAIKSGDKALISSAKSHLRYQIMMRNAEKSTSVFTRSLKKLWAVLVSNPWTAILTALVALGSVLYSVYENATRLDKELAKIGAEGAIQADQSVRNFERLARAIRDSADGSTKQTEALNEMKRAYGDFLPSQDKSIINLVREKDGYNAITQAIREKIAMQIQEQKMNTVASEYGKTLGKWEDEVKDVFGELITPKDKNVIIEGIKDAINEGLISSAKEESDNITEIGKIIKNTTGITGAVGKISDQSGLYQTLRALRNLIETQEEYNASIKDIETSMESATGYVGEYTKSYNALQKSIKDVVGEGEKYSFEWNESVTKKKIEKYHEFIKNNLPKGVTFDIGESIDFKNLYKALGDKYPQFKQVVAKIQGEYEKLIPKDLEKHIKEQFKSIAESEGVSLNEIDEYFKKNDESTQDWVKRLKEAKTEIGNKIFDAKKLGKDTKDLEAQQRVIDKMADSWDNSKTAQKSSEQALKDELATVEKIYKRYQDLRKFKSETDTQSILSEEFAGVSLATLPKAYSPKQMIAVYQKALAEAQRLGKKDLVLEIQTKIGELNIAEEQRNMERELKSLSDQLSHTKTAKDFFNRILGMTGDKELSATLTLSVYGTTGDDLKDALVKQVEQAFEGVDISDAIDYNTMTINYQKLAEIYAKNQDKKLDANKSLAESIVKDGQKISASQIEQWAKELEAVKTYADKRVDIARQTQKRIAEIEASNVDDTTKANLKNQYLKKEEDDLAKLEFQAFKESPMYVSMFDSLDTASTTMLNNMRDKLLELKQSFNELDMPTELKEIQSRLNDIDEQLATRNPFKSLSNAFKEYRVLREQGSRKEVEQDLIDKTNAHANAVAVLTQRIQEAKMAQIEYDAIVKLSGKDSPLAKAKKSQVDNANKAVENQKNIVDGTEEAVKETQKLADAWEAADGMMEESFIKADLLTQAIINLGRNLADAFGGFGSEADAEYFDTMANGLSNLSSGIKDIGVGIVSGNPISIINGIGSAISGLSDIFTAGRVRRANKEIERQKELLEKLEYAYERLEKAQDKALGSDYISNYEKRLKNLQAQQKAYLKQAEAERSKGKKKDKDKIKEYENAARDTADEIKDMRNELSEYFLGTDLTSAARDFANAWIEAYKEFGSTTDAMGEKFRDMVQNMVVESLAGKIMQQLLKPVFDAVDSYSKDGNLDKREIASISNLASGAINGINSAMVELMDRLRASGLNIRNTSSQLTGISRDIASASEESILGLAAGINTQNFYISQVPPKLDTIIALLQGGTTSVGGGVNIQDLITIQNQHLSYLPSIAQHTADTVAECKAIVIETRRTADALERVIKPRGTQSTHVVNTNV